MKIIVEVDTRNPQSAEEIRREAQYLLYVAANLDTFLAGAAAAGASVPTASLAVESAPAAQQVPPPPPATDSANVPAAPAAQVPPPPPAAAAAPAAQVDKTGLPWDARIHSGKPTINADGTWKKRKGVTPPVVSAVEAELRGAAPAAQQVPPPPPAAAAPAAQVPPAPPAVPEAPAAQQVPPPPPAAAAVSAPPSPLTLLQRLASAVSAGKVSFDDVLKEAQNYGCSDLGAVAANPSVATMIEQTFAARGVI